MFGKVLEIPKETTPFNPQSPYGFSRCLLIMLLKTTGYDIFASCGILFNHGSPRRAENFITRKISLNVARLKNNKIKKFSLGNVEAIRGWGYAPEYVYGMWLMLQQNRPDDFVLATNNKHSVKYFLEKSLQHVGIEYDIVGDGVDFKVISQNGDILVDVDKKYYRPSEVDNLQVIILKQKNSKLGTKNKS